MNILIVTEFRKIQNFMLDCSYAPSHGPHKETRSKGKTCSWEGACGVFGEVGSVLRNSFPFSVNCLNLGVCGFSGMSTYMYRTIHNLWNVMLHVWHHPCFLECWCRRASRGCGDGGGNGDDGGVPTTLPAGWMPRPYISQSQIAAKNQIYH